MVVEKQDFDLGEKPCLIPHSYVKFNLTWILELNLRAKTMKFPEENIE